MARNSRTRKADGGSRLAYDVVLMVLGIVVGVVAVVLYQGAICLLYTSDAADE